MGEGMVAGDGDAKAIGGQGDGDDQPAGGCLIEGTDHDVALLAEHGVLAVGRSWFATKLCDRQLVVRQGGAEVVPGGHEGGAGVHQRSAQPDYLALAAELVAGHQGLVDQANDLFGVALKAFAGRGQGDPSAGPGKKGHAQLLFQLIDLFHHRRGG